MKYIFSIVVLISILSILNGCTTVFDKDVITDVSTVRSSSNDKSNMCKYYTNSGGEFYAPCGRLNVGDTINIIKK